MAARLSGWEREEISRGVAAGERPASIGRRLGRATSTITRELDRGSRLGRDRSDYRASRAEHRAWTAARRRRPRRLVADLWLRGLVVGKLRRRWSPQQIAAWLRLEFPHRPEWHVSHETIYQAIYLQGRGSLRAEVERQLALRSGRIRRRPRGRAFASSAGKPWVDLRIAQRPPEADDRAVPGHWEGDLIIGKNSGSAVATLVERTTRYVMLVALPEGKVSPDVVARLAAKMLTLPEHLRRSLAWDQGSELAAHAQFSIATGAKVYFADPHSPWQRGTNENTNGLLRQYLPKTADLRTWTQHDLDTIAHELNTRPRHTLTWKTPAQVLNQHLVATTA